MKAEFREYLSEIKLAQVSIQRIKDIINDYKQFIPDKEPIQIFVCDIIKEGKRQYTSLWLLYDNLICEAKNFLFNVDFDCAPFNSELICYWNLKNKDSDKLIGEHNNINLTISLKSDVGIELNATGNNCYYLLKFFEKLIGHKKS